MLTVGSLFSGIGGLDLGLERAGMRVLWQCESDSYCRAVLRKHWPDVPCYPDIHELAAGLQRVDILAGGFPCQPISLSAGKRRRGNQDQRWLWPEFNRLIRLLRPKYVLMENVPGLLTGGLGEVLGDLAEGGYDAEWDCIPAASFGAPHLRYRIFIIAYPQYSRPPRTRGGNEHKGTVNVFSHARSEGLGPRNSWAVEPGVGRVAVGVANRVERFRGLGNVVVPQVAEAVGRMIVAAHNEEARIA